MRNNQSGQRDIINWWRRRRGGASLNNKPGYFLLAQTRGTSAIIRRDSCSSGCVSDVQGMSRIPFVKRTFLPYSGYVCRHTSRKATCRLRSRGCQLVEQAYSASWLFRFFLKILIVLLPSRSVDTSHMFLTISKDIFFPQKVSDFFPWFG